LCGCTVLRSPVIARLDRVTQNQAPSPNESPGPCVAQERAPPPGCRRSPSNVAPSGISPATCFPMARCKSVTGNRGIRSTVRDLLNASTRLTWMNVSPARGRR
jgi:hypothetical protein